MFEEDIDFDVFPTEIPFKKPSTPEPAAKKRKIIHRKFPGPAGLLSESLEKPEENPIYCSQTTALRLDDELWEHVRKDYPNQQHIHNVSWIKSQKNHQEKIPFLLVAIRAIEIYEGNITHVKVVLEDATGEIQATMTRNVYEENAENLATGCVLALTQTGCLSTTDAPHLIITARNLSAIYTRKKSGQIDCISRKTPDNSQKKTGITPTDNADIWKQVFDEIDPDLLFDDF